LDQTTIKKRRKALSNMPTTLKTAFESTIDRIKHRKSERSDQALEVLKWTFLAQRPLTVIELRHALRVTIDLSKMQLGKLPLSYDETVEWDKFPSEKSLIDWCLGLVIVDVETSTVRLVHKSLYDYLMRLHDDGKMFSDGHSEIAYTCLQYMCFNDDEHEIYPSQTKFTEDIKARRRKRFCLLDYATRNFGYHLRDQDSCTPDMINGLFPNTINLRCISTGLRSQFLSPFHRWGKKDIYSDHEYISTTKIHLRLQFAISCGLGNVFINILNAASQSIDLNTKLGGSTILLQASSIGHDGIVCILLARGVDVNVVDGNYRTAISWASCNGHDAVVKLFLQTEGIDVNSKDDYGQSTAFLVASEKGHDAVVKPLLQMDGIDINSKDRNGWTALSLASENGHDAVVKLLLQKEGIDINSKDGRYDQTALSWASEQGHDSVVKLLLQAEGIDINSKDIRGRTALSSALRYYHTSTVQLLLTPGAIDGRETSTPAISSVFQYPTEILFSNSLVRYVGINYDLYC
jgi:ankyrin repeat protein